ncbi:hypothetical protein J4E91_011030 [Alternaria rosae]|nr:hypothetical protein J4E91_011030 [Alternaria rosae]
MANIKRQRGRYDRDGDAIMTGKVQEKTKDRKPRGKKQDGLSKKERQRHLYEKARIEEDYEVIRQLKRADDILTIEKPKETN